MRCRSTSDFPGYSDMAIGLACMLNIRLSLNFASPYKAANIGEVALSVAAGTARFGRDLNVMATMPLGGFGWLWAARDVSLRVAPIPLAASLNLMVTDIARYGDCVGVVSRHYLARDNCNAGRHDREQRHRSATNDRAGGATAVANRDASAVALSW